MMVYICNAEHSWGTHTTAEAKALLKQYNLTVEEVEYEGNDLMIAYVREREQPKPARDENEVTFQDVIDYKKRNGCW